MLFLFLLPMRSVEIPSIVAGFSINPARLVIVLATLLVIADICMKPARWAWAGWKAPAQPYLRLLVVLFVASTAIYYTEVALGTVVRFGDIDSFFRSWRGRPLGQLISFTTYALIPYLLIRRYAPESRNRHALERALFLATLFLLAYGIAQQISFYAGLPVTGRLLYEGLGEESRVPAYRVGGVLVLRFYSLGGEPRDYGTFMLGAIPFMAYYLGRRRIRVPAWLMFGAGLTVLMTASTSTYLAAAASLAAIIVDAIARGRLRLDPRVALGSAVAVAAALFASGVVEAFFVRTALYWSAFNELVRHTGTVAPEIMVAQASDVGGAFYILNLPQQNPFRLAFGYGFGNFGSGIASVLLDRFGLDVTGEHLSDSRSHFIKILVENGLIGVMLLVAMLLHTLRVSSQHIGYWRERDPQRAKTATWLRIAYITFFVAAMVQVSYVHFLIMGLIMATESRMLVYTRVAAAANPLTKRAELPAGGC